MGNNRSERSGRKISVAWKVYGSIFISMSLAGYLSGRAASPDYSSVGGELAFRRFAADHAAVEELTFHKTLSQEGQLETISTQGGQLRLECGATAFVYDLMSKALATVPSQSKQVHVPMQGPEFTEALVYVTGGIEAYRAPTTLFKATALLNKAEDRLEQFKVGAIMVIAAATGFLGGSYLGYQDELNCVDMNFQRNLRDPVFWAGVAEEFSRKRSWKVKHGSLAEMFRALNRELTAAGDGISYRMGEVWSEPLERQELWVIDALSNPRSRQLFVHPQKEPLVTLVKKVLREAGESELVAHIDAQVRLRY